jgi:hypothetical protein
MVVMKSEVEKQQQMRRVWLYGWGHSASTWISVQVLKYKCLRGLTTVGLKVGLVLSCRTCSIHNGI